MIVGQDTDGTVTPHDLGMGWIVRKDGSDFIGSWPIASFRCAAEFGRYPGIADFGKPSARQIYSFTT